MTARFEVCTCQKHGHIVLADAFRSTEVCFKELGFHLVRVAVQLEALSDAEAETVMDEILASALPTTAVEVSPGLLWNAEVLNKISMGHEAEVQQWRMEIIHVVLFMAVDKGEIPANIFAVAEKLVRSSLT